MLLEPNDHPESDMSPELGEDGVAKCQSLIGSLQWAVSLGRLDVTTAVSFGLLYYSHALRVFANMQ